MKIHFSTSFQYFPASLFLGLILLPECIVTSGFLGIMYVSVILFCTIPDINMVNLERLFMQGGVKYSSEGH